MVPIYTILCQKKGTKEGREEGRKEGKHGENLGYDSNKNV
jgi:hypothetical protein